MDAICPQKGVGHTLDRIGGSPYSMASGIGEWLHDGRGHSCPAGHCRHRSGDPPSSGPKGLVAIWTLAGEVRYFERRWSAGQNDIAEFQDVWKLPEDEVLHGTILKSHLQEGI